MSKTNPEDELFEVEIERKKFNEEGEKVSKPQNQFMNPSAFAHFLLNANAVGWSVKIKKEPKNLEKPAREQVNKGIDGWNDANKASTKKQIKKI